MSYDSGDCAEEFAESSEELLNALCGMGLSNLSPSARAAYTRLNRALCDYQEYLLELQEGKTSAY
jgi:hypothetical protein